MNSCLFLLIEESWPDDPAAAWVLADEAGAARSQGRSAPRDWPPAASCVVVLAGAQCSSQRVTLPRGSRREESRLLAYALEDRLLRDPESQHLVVTRREPGERGPTLAVTVVARERLRAVLAQLAAIGRAPATAYAELNSLPGEAGRWHLSIAPHALILSTAPGSVQALDAPLAAAMPVLRHALDGARTAGAAPGELVLHPVDELPPGAAAELATAGLAVSTGDGHAWWRGHERAGDLLQGEFAPRHRGEHWTHRLRWPLRLGAASLAALLIADLGEVWLQRQRLAELEARMQRVFETAVPNTPAILPAAQLQRRLDQQRELHGRLREDDLLSLLGAVVQAGGVAARDAVSALDYREGRLELSLAAGDPAQHRTWLQRLAALGVRAQASGQRLVITPEPTR